MVLDFYTVSRAKTSRDRLLLSLKRQHLEHYLKVCDGQCSPYRAALNAGLVEVGESRSLKFGTYSVAAAKKLGTKKQGTLLREMFPELSLDAQCALIADVLDPHLCPDLAKRWRAHTLAKNGNPSVS
jgi:hypothetical protein